MEIRELRSLVMLSELGSITQVGTTLQLTPAAIHKQLKSLERELQVPLYERRGRRLQLTQGAEVILPHVQEILAHYRAAVTVLDEWKGIKHGLVRIGASTSISSYILPPIVKRFRDQYPNVDLLVESGSSPWLLERLETGSLDLAMMITDDQRRDGQLSSRASWRYEVMLVSGVPGTPERCAIHELAQQPFVLFQKGGRIEDLVARYFAEVGFRPRVVMRLDNAEAIRAMIRSGLGISMLPYWTIEDDVKSGALRVIRQRERSLHTRVELVSAKSRYLSHPVIAFSETAQKEPPHFRSVHG